VRTRNGDVYKKIALKLKNKNKIATENREIWSKNELKKKSILNTLSLRSLMFKLTN